MSTLPARARRSAQRSVAIVATLLLALLCALPAPAQSAATLSGTITANGAPAAGVAVTATGANTVLHARTDARGRFRFPGVPIGTYTVSAAQGRQHNALRVDVAAEGADITLALTDLQTIGQTAVTSRPPVRGSGTDLTLTGENLTRSPASRSLPGLLLTLPGAARGANGVVHINGDHGDVNYVVDGAPIPQELNRNIGEEVDPQDLAFVQVLQGAYPAEYGERFAAVIDASTRTGGGPPGFTADVVGGSYAAFDGTFGYHAPLGTGNLVAAVRNRRGLRELDPPQFDSPHDAGSLGNQFLRYTQPLGKNFFNLTLSHTYQTYQIPVDVSGGAPAATDDVETQDDLFATARFRHPIGDHGSLSFGPNVKRSRIRDFGDPSNDIAYGIASNPGAPTDCATALLPGSTLDNPQPNPAVGYVNGTCAYSLNGDRTATDVGGNLDYALTSAHHEIRAGALYDATHVDKRYAITLQPGNFLAPLLTLAAPGGAVTVVDAAPNNGHLTAAYLQDSWRMGQAWQLDAGVRADSFLVSSTQFAAGFGQLSPRVKLTRFLGGGRDSVYAYYGRFFTPFSLENVSPDAAYRLNLPLQAGNPAAFDLKPQRDSVYEVGGHVALRRGDLGVRIMQKNASDLIDDTQVGVTNLHQDINYAEGRIATQSAYYQLGLPRAGRIAISLTHTYSVNRGCETQLLAPCFGAPSDWTPADHDQRIDVNASLLTNDRRGGWFAVDGEYGSGLSAALNPNGITCGGPVLDQGGPCKRTPHLTFDVEKGFALGHGMALTARVLNLLNDRYYVTYANAQGNHVAAPREFELGLRIGR